MPDTPEPHMLSATEAIRRIAAGRLSGADWVASCQQRIRDRDPAVQAWASVNADAVAEARAQAQRDRASTIPVGVKDIIDVRGLPTLMGTDFHDPRPPTREGGSVALLRQAGCVFMGKTTTTELGHRHPAPTRNPHDLDHTPGGSSSGSAAAVADMMVPVCLGTQTSSSVIRPAAYCGVIGYKPTFNDFDRTGILANAPSMDTLGILARSVADVGLLRRILLEQPLQDIAPADPASLTVALLQATPWEKADAETQALLEGFVGDLAARGARRVDMAIDDDVARLLALHRLISGFEFRRSIAFERFNHFDQLSAVLREGRLADGQQIDSRGYQNALREAAAIRARLALAFDGVDLVVAPSAAGPAPGSLETTGDIAFSSAWTLAGNPLITLPLFRSADNGLPIGCQLIAGMGDDDRLLAAASGIVDKFGDG